MTTDSSRPSISVVIPLYNKGEAIARTIESVFNQSRLPDELVVVDDGSSDGSLGIAQEFISKADNAIKCTVITQKNSGVSAARNRGADETITDYISFLDADDEWLPDYLSEVDKLARAYPAATALTIRSAKINEDRVIVPEPSSLPEPYFGRVENILDVYRRGYGLIHTSAVTIRRDAWKRSGGFPVGALKSQDIYLWLKLCLSESFAHSSRPLSIWHDDFSGLSRRKGVVPYHFLFFLGTDEGRIQLENAALVEFLSSNMLAHIGGHRLNHDNEVVEQLRRLSGVFPLRHRFKCWLISVLPIACLQVLVWCRQRSRGLKR